jgi:hypothetical protein
MRTVCIVGSAPTTREDAPWDDLTKPIWVFNEAAEIEWCKRADAVFQMHLPEVYRSPLNRTDPKHWEWLQQEHGAMVIYMQDVDPAVPNSCKYPLDEIFARYRFHWPDGDPIRFITSTPAFAVALAVYQGYEKIEIYGCDLHSNTEYQYQRDNFAFWVGIALGEGVEVEMHGGWDLFDVPVYGYEGTPVYPLVEIVKELPFLEQQTAIRNAEYEAAKAKDAESLGLLGQEEYFEIHGKTIDAAIEAGYASGMLDEAKWNIDRGDAPHRQVFEQHGAGARQNSLAFTSLMNLETGRAMAFIELKEYGNYKEAVKKQLEYAFSMGVEKGKAYFNRQHMLHMDLLIRSAGGRKAAQYAAESTEGGMKQD